MTDKKNAPDAGSEEKAGYVRPSIFMSMFFCDGCTATRTRTCSDTNEDRILCPTKVVSILALTLAAYALGTWFVASL